MMAISLDTHKAIKHLMNAGFSPQQAEGMIDTLQQVNTSQLVTKTDMAEFKTDIYKFIMVNTIATIGLTVGLVVTLVKLL